MVSSTRAHPQALGFWLMWALKDEASTGHRTARFEDELELEALRATDQPHAVSRLTGFYVFDDRLSAERATREWRGGFRLDGLEEVGILDGSRWSRHDAQWITNGIGSADRSWMLPYLRGEPSGPEPIWELLVDGRAVMYGADLRKAAYDVVRRAWPKTLALLELSRVAVELRSDLGLIAAMFHGSADRRRVDFFLNFEDATNQEYLDRFAEYDGPKNTADVPPDFELVLPDLRPYSFELPQPSATGSP